ncbi:BrnA antitoxin family protein [Sphingobium sp. D43FB]|uniref:BrnA antitoxin family protein n=1 Tax=Sphingobium sp. D43FB TaxID=2017595 RepID=UPI0020D1838C|nr:BrnA antitoxin family protein [Sphingobium sp. D43FB]
MTGKDHDTKPLWVDPDDAPELDEHFFAHAEFRIGGKVIRPATGTLTKVGRPKSDDPKQQVTLRLDAAVLDGFRATGPGWQSRINAELRKALGL